MWKILLVMRHGSYIKTGIGKWSLSDVGVCEVNGKALELIKKDTIPDLIIYSPIQRALETAGLMKKMFNERAGLDISIVRQAKLRHNQSSARIQDILKLDEVHENLNTIMFITHLPNADNIGFSLDKHEPDLNTSDVVKYELAVDNWSDVLSYRTKVASRNFF